MPRTRSHRRRERRSRLGEDVVAGILEYLPGGALASLFGGRCCFYSLHRIGAADAPGALSSKALLAPLRSNALRVPEQYATLEAAVAASGNGDTIFVSGDVFVRRKILAPSHALRIVGLAPPPRRFGSTTEEHADVDACAKVWSEHVPCLFSAEGPGVDLVIAGLALLARDGEVAGETGVWVNRGATVAVRNCYVAHYDASALCCGSEGELRVADCTVTDCDNCVGAYSSARVIVERCRIGGGECAINASSGAQIDVRGSHIQRCSVAGIISSRADSCVRFDRGTVYASMLLSTPAGQIQTPRAAMNGGASLTLPNGLFQLNRDRLGPGEYRRAGEPALWPWRDNRHQTGLLRYLPPEEAQRPGPESDLFITIRHVYRDQGPGRGVLLPF
mmetsp:Transcript_13846/g.41217  ORF Transcript_13846/g.41217 Transcript_13846/m.41217 type:complete len:390 (-) Transcript_13846:20-1189(-)